MHHLAMGTKAENFQLKSKNISHLVVEYCLITRKSFPLEEKHISEVHFHLKLENLKGSLVSSWAVY